MSEQTNDPIRKASPVDPLGVEHTSSRVKNTINKKKKSSAPKMIIGLAIIAAAATGIALYYNHLVKYPHTDDAYVNANLVNVAPKVGGFIKQINVTKNQLVHKGDTLFEIDPLDYTLEANQSEQTVSVAQQQADAAKQSINISKVNVAKAQSDYEYNRKMAKRYTDLFNQKAGTEQDMQKWVNNATQAKQQLDQAKLSYAQAATQYQATLAQLSANKAALDSAVTQTSYTQIKSGVDGYITNLNLTNGQLVQPGQNLFGIIDDSDWWIDANFKETQLARIKVGQSVKVKLDMYDEHEYKGTVQSLSRGSGNTFSILPAQNATGNWVKVTQRFAVTIKVQDDPKFPLRVGASAYVTVDTTK